jgi:photosystem II stability/assembly factor-like uncharacterized protein
MVCLCEENDAMKMIRPVVEKTICLLIAIAFSIPVALAQNRDFTIQVESAPSESEAKLSVSKLRAQGLDAYWIKADIPGVGIRYRVRIGRYQTQAEAKAKADQLIYGRAIREFIIVVYDAPTGSAPPIESKPKVPERIGNKDATPQRKASNTEPATTTPAGAETQTDVTINDANWKVVKHGAEIGKDLRAIYFVDSMTGWVAGDAGVVYHTTDGGRDWKPLSSGSTADINFIYFIDLNRGWMIGKSSGKRGDEAESENILFITTSGGREWIQRPLPYVTSLYFLDAYTGWAVGRRSTLLKTTDGGLEWSKVKGVEKLIDSQIEPADYSFGFSDIRFTDARHGWLIGNFYGRARSDIGGVFMTSDGGSTWYRVPLAIQTRNNSGRFTPGSLHSAHFTNANTGSITGEMYDGESRYFFALHTRDGGLTWNLFRIPSRATHSSQFLDPARGWTAAFAPRESGGAAGVYDTTLMRTDNGGLSWRKDLIARGRQIRGVFFMSPTKGWAVGDGGMILSYEERSKAN